MRAYRLKSWKGYRRLFLWGPDDSICGGRPVRSTAAYARYSCQGPHLTPLRRTCAEALRTCCRTRRLTMFTDLFVNMVRGIVRQKVRKASAQDLRNGVKWGPWHEYLAYAAVLLTGRPPHIESSGPHRKSRR